MAMKASRALWKRVMFAIGASHLSRISSALTSSTGGRTAEWLDRD
jgi:hypothetical protein